MTRQEINRFANKVCDNEKSFNEVVKVCTEYEKQIEKMKCCGNCKYCDADNPCPFHKENRQCENYYYWELAE